MSERPRRFGWTCGQCKAHGDTPSSELSERDLLKHYDEAHPEVAEQVHLAALGGLFLDDESRARALARTPEDIRQSQPPGPRIADDDSDQDGDEDGDE